MIDLMGLTDITASAGGMCAGIYVMRLNDLHPRSHVLRCIAVQVAGLLLGSWVLGTSHDAGGLVMAGNVAAVLGMSLHILVTADRWADGAPQDAESSPMPLDGARQ